jgi:hypothetical protein
VEDQQQNSLNNVIFLDLTTSPISILQTPLFEIDEPTDVAITPDQAPTARFTATFTKHKGDGWQKVEFDASDSTSPVGDIAKYEWKFGDGHKVVTTSPRVWHTYHHLHDGERVHVKLTVTNTAGTSRSVVFTGRTVSNNGGSSATLVKSLVFRS